MTEIKSPPPRHNFALRFLERFIAVPRRFTAAFVLSVPLLVWMAFSFFLFSGWKHEGFFLTHVDRRETVDLSWLMPTSPMLGIGLCLMAEMALSLTFALLKERGVSVTPAVRWMIHVLPVLISAGYILFAFFAGAPRFFAEVSPTEQRPFYGFTFGFPRGAVLAVLCSISLFILSPIAVPLFAGDKKSLAPHLGRLVLAFFIAGVLSLALFIAFGCLSAVIPGAIFGIALLPVAFPWLFMAGIPETAKKAAEVSENIAENTETGAA